MPVAIIPIPVPASGLGPVVDISALIGPKTVIFTGKYEGSFTLLVSHTGAQWAPAKLFDSKGLDGIVATLGEAYGFARVQSNGFSGPNSTLQISGVSKPGENKFAVLANLNQGSMGLQVSIDTWALFPPTGLEADVDVICEGSFDGYIVVEGSQDNVHWNAFGTFQALMSSASGNLQFTPIVLPPFVRYVSAKVKGTILTPTTVTIGGRIPADNDQPTSGVVIDLSGSPGGVFTALPAGPTEGILYEYAADLTKLGVAASIAAELNGIAKFAPGGGGPLATFNVYVGATTPGNTAGGTLVATFNTASPTEVKLSGQGGTFANPGGLTLVQVTGSVANVGDSAYLRGVFIFIG